MKGLTKLMAALLFAVTLTGCSADAPILPDSDARVSMLAVNAGGADAILLTADGHSALIDTAFCRSMGTVRYGMEVLGIERLDYVIATHTDDDHVNGLEWLADSDIEVSEWCASALYTDVKEKKHPISKAAAKREASVRWLSAGDSLTLGSATLDVLAPDGGGSPADDEDNNSLVVMLNSGFGRILLTGDMENEEESWLLASGADLRCDVLKVPNHGDGDTGSAEFFKRTSPEVAVISTSSLERSDTPDLMLLRRLKAVCKNVYTTQDSGAGVLVELSEAGITAGQLALPESACSLDIISVLHEHDTITLANNGKDEAKLDGWYLYSSAGDELFIFPDGTAIPSGAELTIGTRSTDIDYDILWDDKKVISKKKNDTISLYDPYGNCVSKLTNGIDR